MTAAELNKWLDRVESMLSHVRGNASGVQAMLSHVVFARHAAQSGSDSGRADAKSYVSHMLRQAGMEVPS